MMPVSLSISRDLRSSQPRCIVFLMGALYLEPWAESLFCCVAAHGPCWVHLWSSHCWLAVDGWLWMAGCAGLCLQQRLRDSWSDKRASWGLAGVGGLVEAVTETDLEPVQSAHCATSRWRLDGMSS